MPGFSGTRSISVPLAADTSSKSRCSSRRPGHSVATAHDGDASDRFPLCTVSPAAGTKVSKVAGLADDLALALARKVRIVAPIPGKNRIGFELPNEQRVPVVLRELIEDRRFQTIAKPLPVVIAATYPYLSRGDSER